MITTQFAPPIKTVNPRPETHRLKLPLVNPGYTFTAIALLVLTAAPIFVAEDSKAPSPPVSLPADQVIDNLIRNNEERAKALLHSEAIRVYRLTYRGFPSDREAEMTVQATYDSPSSKEFKVISQSGSKLVQDRVFKRLL